MSCPPDALKADDPPEDPLEEPGTKGSRMAVAPSAADKTKDVPVDAIEVPVHAHVSSP